MLEEIGATNANSLGMLVLRVARYVSLDWALGLPNQAAYLSIHNGLPGAGGQRRSTSPHQPLISYSTSNSRPTMTANCSRTLGAERLVIRAIINNPVSDDALAALEGHRTALSFGHHVRYGPLNGCLEVNGLILQRWSSPGPCVRDLSPFSS